QHLTIFPGINPPPSSRVHEAQAHGDGRECPRLCSPPPQEHRRGPRASSCPECPPEGVSRRRRPEPVWERCGRSRRGRKEGRGGEGRNGLPKTQSTNHRPGQFTSAIKSFHHEKDVRGSPEAQRCARFAALANERLVASSNALSPPAREVSGEKPMSTNRGT